MESVLLSCTYRERLLASSQFYRGPSLVHVLGSQALKICEVQARTPFLGLDCFSAIHYPRATRYREVVRGTLNRVCLARYTDQRVPGRFLACRGGTLLQVLKNSYEAVWPAKSLRNGSRESRAA